MCEAAPVLDGNGDLDVVVCRTGHGCATSSDPHNAAHCTACSHLGGDA